MTYIIELELTTDVDLTQGERQLQLIRLLQGFHPRESELDPSEILIINIRRVDRKD